MFRRIKAWLLNPVVATGLWIGLVGSAMNYSVLMANGGMPVCGQKNRIGIHIPLNEFTVYPALSDCIHILDRVLSPGDIVIYAGISCASVGILWGYLRGAQCR